MCVFYFIIFVCYCLCFGSCVSLRKLWWLIVSVPIPHFIIIKYSVLFGNMTFTEVKWVKNTIPCCLQSLFFPVDGPSLWVIMAGLSANSTFSLNTAGGQEKIIVETLCICGCSLWTPTSHCFCHKYALCLWHSLKSRINKCRDFM